MFPYSLFVVGHDCWLDFAYAVFFCLFSLFFRSLQGVWCVCFSSTHKGVLELFDLSLSLLSHQQQQQRNT
jgi:hypothetical protein